MSSIQSNFQKIQKELEKYSAAKLVAVSKYTSDEKVQELYELGQRDFGENRVPELLQRSQHFPADIRWHFIGNLQSNKIKKLLSIGNLAAIHSVDRMEILEKLAGQNLKNNLEFYLQVNVSGEDEKHGFDSFENLKAAVEFSFSSNFPKMLKLQGLMAMAAIRTDDYLADARVSFEKLREWRDQLVLLFPTLKLDLNMGMSQDYPLALSLGSKVIRVGSTLFQDES